MYVMSTYGRDKRVLCVDKFSIRVLLCITEKGVDEMSDKKSVSLGVRVTQEEADKMRELAELDNRSVSSWARLVLLSQIKKGD